MSYEKIKAMLVMQDTMNKKVHPEWQLQGFRWTRAIMVEGVEALEHYGWKWWKKQEPDMAQFRIELVDIWHFIMSEHIGRSSIEDAAHGFETTFEYGAPAYMTNGDIRTNLELLIGRAAAGEIYTHAFLALLDQTGMSLDDLYRAYVAKNVLNMFRQNNGYKEGTYIKIWNGHEDNVVLERYLLDNPDISQADLDVALTEAYGQVKAHAGVVA